MKRIIVIGCPGSGKSTLSRALHIKTGIPLYHLDMMYWNPDKTTVEKEVFYDRLRRVLEEDTFIIDGNYQSTMEMRLKACDTVFFLDYPVDICLEGIAVRKGKVRPDMPWVEIEDDPEFLEFVKRYNSDCKPKVEVLLSSYKHVNCVVFRFREEANIYLEKLNRQ